MLEKVFEPLDELKITLSAKKKKLFFRLDVILDFIFRERGYFPSCGGKSSCPQFITRPSTKAFAEKNCGTKYGGKNSCGEIFLANNV